MENKLDGNTQFELKPLLVFPKIPVLYSITNFANFNINKVVAPKKLEG